MAEKVGQETAIKDDKRTMDHFRRGKSGGRQAREYGNPFRISHDHLLKLDTQEAFEPAVYTAISSVEQIGLEQYEKYRKEVLEEGTKSVHDTIKKNSFPLLTTPLRRVVTPAGKKLKTMTLNASIFSQAVAILQQREISLSKMFSFEFHWFAPAISNFGELYLPGNKSSLVNEIVSKCHSIPEDTSIDTYIFDGGRLPFWCKPKKQETFAQYASGVIKFLEFLFRFYIRLHIVFDVYRKNSLKAATRDKRGRGVRQRVAGSTKVPNDWNQFLRESENKDELNKFLAETITAHTFASGKQIFITHQEHVLSNITSVGNMVDCSHEEADTRMMIHLEHALSNGAQTVAIDSGDTDVLIIVLGLYHQLKAKYNFNDVILDFSQRRFSIATLAQGLGEAKCQALPYFHALTGCDTTSAFKNISKKKGFETLSKLYIEAQTTFSSFFFNPFRGISSDSAEFKVIQRFVVLLYARTSQHQSVNDARLELYFQNSQNLERIPPTADALLNHVKRAIYQTGIWGSALEPQPNIPSPHLFGWKRDDPNSNWEPVWITQGEANKECREFVKCSCKLVCTRCKCANANLNCKLLCGCSCSNKFSYS